MQQTLDERAARTAASMRDMQQRRRMDWINLWRFMRTGRGTVRLTLWAVCVCVCDVGVLWLNAQTDRARFTEDSNFVLDGGPDLHTERETSPQRKPACIELVNSLRPSNQLLKAYVHRKFSAPAKPWSVIPALADLLYTISLLPDTRSAMTFYFDDYSSQP